jgi:hypothetical protein
MAVLHFAALACDGGVVPNNVGSIRFHFGIVSGSMALLRHFFSGNPDLNPQINA